MESQDIECYNNYVADCGACIGFRNMPDRTGFLKNIYVHDNVLADWRNEAVVTSIGEWSSSVWTPDSFNIRIDNNKYCPPGGKHIYYWIGQKLYSLSDITQKLGFDANSAVDCNAKITLAAAPPAPAGHANHAAPTALHILFRTSGRFAGGKPPLVYDLRGRLSGSTTMARDGFLSAPRAAHGACIIRNFPSGK
jgi:hypothetical protein